MCGRVVELGGAILTTGVATRKKGSLSLEATPFAREGVACGTH